MSIAAMSASPRCTDQCNAVLPSGADAFTSGDLSSNARTRARSACRAASTSAGVVAARAMPVNALRLRSATIAARRERSGDVMTASDFYRSASLPVLSAIEGRLTSTLSSSVRPRFMNGVFRAYFRCRPPFNRPQPPPASTTGRSTGV